MFGRFWLPEDVCGRKNEIESELQKASLEAQTEQQLLTKLKEKHTQELSEGAGEHNQIGRDRVQLRRLTVE